MVGRNIRTALRWLRGLPRRCRAVGGGRRRFCGARRRGLERAGAGRGNSEGVGTPHAPARLTPVTRRIPLALLAIALASPAAAQFNVTGVVLPPSAGGPVAAPTSGPPPDLAFGAYQRGYYVTALREAMKRLAANPKDGPAMTLIGEIYRDGVGVKRDYAEAARWYRL